jgi:hypothetical protein
MAGIRYEFSATLYRWAARRELWVFAQLPADVSEEIADMPHPPAGFNSVKVQATLGSSRWSTSIFPGGDGAYVLVVSRAIRERENVSLGDTVRIGIETLL